MKLKSYNRLANKNVIITGGSRGIGSAIAKRFAAEGANVAITFVNDNKSANETVDYIIRYGGSARAIQIDNNDELSVRSGMQNAANSLGSVDIIVHNAGIVRTAVLGDITTEDYRSLMNVNLDAIFHGTNACLPYLNDAGRILVIGSVAAHHIMEGGAVYSATKAGVTALARGWARELGHRGICVNILQPGPINTDLNPENGELAKIVAPSIALKRYGQPHEVAALAAFLASDEASFITGASIDVDGGYSI